MLLLGLVTGLWLAAAIATMPKPLPAVDPNTPLFRVPVNIADATTLELLPGVGPGRAAAMIEQREAAPFADAADLQRVSGIGPILHERLAPYVRFDAP